jgi:alcohol dehydrogenase
MWRYDNPVKVIFGSGTVERIGAALAGRSYCLVTYDEPYFAGIGNAIAQDAGPPALIINGISPNPDMHMLSACCARLATAPSLPQVILALGGGSVMDAAKVLAVGGQGFGPVSRYLETGEGADELTALPIIAVPTTAGTGSEVTSWATIWDTDAMKKYSLHRRDLYPEAAIVDPDLMLGMPRDLTVATALDALSHALESLWNRNANPISGNYAVFAATEMLDCLPELVLDLGNPALRSRVARAAIFAGLAFSNTRTALAHSLSYPVTLKHGVAHGIACSFSLPAVMRSAIGVHEDCDAALKRIFGDDLSRGADRLEKTLKELGVATDKAAYGIGDEELYGLIDSALTGDRGKNFIGSRKRVMKSFGFAGNDAGAQPAA